MEDYKSLEQSIIGILLIDQSVLSRIKISEEYFYDSTNREIVKVLLDMHKENKPIDLISISIETNNKFISELMNLTARTSSKANIEYFVAVLIEKYTARKITSLCTSIVSELNTEGNDVYKSISKLIREIDGISFNSTKDFQEFNPIVLKTLKKIEELQKLDQHLIGLDTGYNAMNSMTNGWQAPDLIILAARPGMGKTALALNFARNLVVQNIPVAMFSLEMSSEQLSKRLISNMSGVYSNYITKATLDEGGWSKILNTNFDVPLYIDDTAGISLTELKEKCRKAVRSFNVKMIIVDYLQLINVYGIKNREEQISTISRSLKGLAKELEIPILALAQLSRDVEKRGGEPRLSDLRESGAIEQDADIVGFIHNEDLEAENPEIKVILAKHRNGETGFFRLQFEKSKSKFNNI